MFGICEQAEQIVFAGLFGSLLLVAFGYVAYCIVTDSGWNALLKATAILLGVCTAAVAILVGILVVVSQFVC